jgi:hypothetical protein
MLERPRASVLSYEQAGMGTREVGSSVEIFEKTKGPVRQYIHGIKGITG